MKRSAATIRDVAKASGLSPATISIVLNNAPLARYLLPATKKKIAAAAKKLRYRPNLIASSLRSKRSHSVGVMVFDIADPYCALILRGIVNCLYQSNFLPILTDAHNQRSRFERYLEMMLDRRIEGLILLANWLFLDINLIADLAKSGIPIVSIGSELRTDSVSSVIVDNESGGRLALEHFCSLGHREIAFIRGPKSLSDSRPRWKGARSSAQSNGFKLNARLMMELPDSSDAISSFEVGCKLTEELINRNRDFTAIMALRRFGGVWSHSGAVKSRHPSPGTVFGYWLRRHSSRRLIHPGTDHGSSTDGKHGDDGSQHHC